MNIETLINIDFNTLKADVYDNACKHGFHDEKHELPHWLCLVICELSEAVEADRKGKRARLDLFNTSMKETEESIQRAMKEPFCEPSNSPDPVFDYSFRTYIKDTVEDELADTVIRLLDLAGERGVDLSDLFSGTVHSWDESASFTEMIFDLQAHVVLFFDSRRKLMPQGVAISELIKAIYGLADRLGAELHTFVTLKMEYNKHREFKHGKKY